MREKEGDVLLDDVPQDVVVDAEIGMDQPVAGGDDLAPGDLGRGFADFSGNAGGRLAKQLKVPRRGVIGKAD